MTPATRITGRHIYNRAGEDLGVIEDLGIDLSTGRIVYAVLAFGGFLGIGDKLFAVPWDALEVDGEGFLADATRAELAETPGFDREHWPEHA